MSKKVSIHSLILVDDVEVDDFLTLLADLPELVDAWTLNRRRDVEKFYSASLAFNEKLRS